MSKKTSHRCMDPRVIHVRDKDGYPPIVDEGRVGLLAAAFVFLIEPLTNSCILQQQQRWRRRDYVTPARSLMRTHTRAAMYIRARARTLHFLMNARSILIARILLFVSAGIRMSFLRRSNHVARTRTSITRSWCKR